MSNSKIEIPEACLVVLVGAAGAGKSTFAARHFRPSEVLSSDRFRLMVADDENDQSATAAAFEVLHLVARKRLAGRRLTVVDATNTETEAREPLLAMARVHGVPAVAVLLDVPRAVCESRNAGRADHTVPVTAVRQQLKHLRKAHKLLRREGFDKVFVLRGVDEVDAAVVERRALWSDRCSDQGPFDIVGDVHGCANELVSLLEELGYEVAADRTTARHPGGRTAVFVGDLVDRGPDTPGVLRLVMGMVHQHCALCVPGNHENKLLRALQGRNVRVGHGLAESLEQLSASPPELRAEVVDFIDRLPSHLVLDEGRLVVAHAGLPEPLHHRDSPRAHSFALYGETTGETDEMGLPVRYPWAEDYRGKAIVVYGHTPVREPEWVNNTICIDTGCVFGGRLTALRYPEAELVSVPATAVHYDAAASVG